MFGGTLDGRHLINLQAEIYKVKSEYLEARSIHTGILREASPDQYAYYGITLLNIAEIDVAIGAPKEDVQRNCDTAKEIFKTAGLGIEVTMCNATLADLYLREGNMLAAKTLFESCLKLSLRPTEVMSYCLERLGDVSRWGAHDQMSGWTTVFLVHSLRRKQKLGIYKALQFLGDLFLAQDDEHTAITLFTVALEGFTNMDVHRSRAECMLRLGDISKSHGNLIWAVELWETARPLFEQSCQAKQVEQVDERLVGMDEDLLEQHRENLVRLAKLNVPSAAAENMDDPPDIEAVEELELDDEKEQLVAVQILGSH
jgi:tetratricopeptide (TPR) repeat protein